MPTSLLPLPHTQPCLLLFPLARIVVLRSSPTMAGFQALSFRNFCSVSFAIFFGVLTTMSVTESLKACSSNTAGLVIPTTPLVHFLERVQQTALSTFGESQFDPKPYVDMSLKFELSTAEAAFDKLPKSENGSISVEDLKGFMEKYLESAGDDMVYVEPVDFVQEPEGFLPKVENAEVRAWALEVHALWKNLSRKVSDEVLKRPELHTLLPLPKPVVIPGSRFREVNYWDSYWIIRGLLASKMYETAKAIVTNLIHLIEEYGHVLNGARSYYTNRSQPPLLSAMIHEIYHRTGDVQLVKKSLPSLVKEHHFWSSEIHKVTIQDAQSYNHTLNRYYAMWNKPRPESSTIDKHFASKITNISEKQKFYHEVASTAESGWDFSTRWMRNHSDLTTLATTSVLPVDLNAFILRMELDIAFLAKVTGDQSTAEHFLKASQARVKAFKSIFWNSEMGQWLDYWLNDSTCQEPQNWEACNQNQNVYASNFIPLWIESFYSDTALVKKVMKGFQSSGLLFPAGIATSLANSGQQWLVTSFKFHVTGSYAGRNLDTLEKEEREGRSGEGPGFYEGEETFAWSCSSLFNLPTVL